MMEKNDVFLNQFVFLNKYTVIKYRFIASLTRNFMLRDILCVRVEMNSKNSGISPDGSTIYIPTTEIEVQGGFELLSDETSILITSTSAGIARVFLRFVSYK